MQLFEWRNLEFRENRWPVALDRLLRSEDDSVILVASKRHAKFRAYQSDLELLRVSGIAELD